MSRQSAESAPFGEPRRATLDVLPFHTRAAQTAKSRQRFRWSVGMEGETAAERGEQMRSAIFLLSPTFSVRGCEEFLLI